MDRNKDLLSTLPSELLLLVGGYADTFSLWSLLLVSRLLNGLLTEVLYSSINLQCFKPTLICLRTLSSEPVDLTFGRDLAGLVRKFQVAEFDTLPLTRQSLEELERRTTLVLPRLVNIRHLSFRPSGILSFQALLGTIVSSNGQLTSLDVTLADEELRSLSHIGSYTPHCDRDPPRVNHLRSLDSLKIQGMWDAPPSCIELVSRLVASQSNTIHTLALVDSDPELAGVVVRSAACFPALGGLELDAQAFFANDFTHEAFPSVRTLVLRGDLQTLSIDPVPPLGLDVIPDSAYPALETLSCDVDFLPLLLRRDTGTLQPRPLHTVQLNEASYARNGGTFSPIAPAWNEVAVVLMHLPRSGTFVRHLSFNVHEIDAHDLAEVLPYMKALESLLIVTVREPNFQLEGPVQIISEMLGEMPHLHTFLFSDAPLKTEDNALCFNIAWQRGRQREIVRRWGMRAPALRRVAFTTEMEWVRRGEEWAVVDD